MKRGIFLTAILMLAWFPMGCAKNTALPVVHLAQFLTDPVLISKLTAVVADIQKRHPDFKIQLDNIPYNEYQQKIMTQIAGNDAPDVIFVEVNNFVDLFLRGAFEDLTPYCQKDGVDLKGYYAGVIHRFSPDGKIYAIPQDTAPSGLIFYNRKMFRDAGIPYPKGDWTWPEPFLSICQKLTQKNASGKITRFAFCDAYSTQYENFLFGNGANYVDDTDHPTRLALDDPKALEAIHFRWALIQQYHVSPDPSQLQTFSMAEGQAREYLQELMLEAGLTVRVDAFGNIIGRMELLLMK